MTKFVAQHLQDFRRPEELVLEVDQELGSAKSSQVGLENSKITPGDLRIHVVRNGADQLHLDVTGRRRGGDRGKRLPRRCPPAHGEVFGDFPHGGPRQPRRDVMPTDLAYRGMVWYVTLISAVVG